MSAPEETASPTLAGYGASSRIRAALPEMPEGMAKVGRLLLEDPSLPLQLPITELAERAGASPATVTRFCRAIGYTGYPALRVGAAAEQGRSSAHETWNSDIGRARSSVEKPRPERISAAREGAPSASISISRA